MQTALVTGSSRGIGRAIAERLSQDGFTVFACGRTDPSGVSFSPDLPITYLTADVSKEDDVQRLFDEIHRRGFKVDALVNNAGISYIGLIQDMSVQDFDQVMTINLRSAFLCTRLALRDMIPQQKGGIVNISSMWGQDGASMEAAYSASKGGLDAFTKAVAKEVAPSGILVNAVACGAIDTDMNQFLSAEERKSLEEGIGLGRFGTPAEAAELVSFLLSKRNTYMTGQILRLDGIWP